MDVAPASTIEISYRVTARLRIATNARQHHYHRSLCDPLSDGVHDVAFPWRRGSEPGDLDAFFREIDLFHVHWPEHFLGGDHEAQQAVLQALERNQVRVIYTRRNLVPRRQRRHSPQRVGQTTGW